MAQYLLTGGLMVLSIIVWVLWKAGVYPLTEPVFMHSGYGMHVVGGIGYTAFQVMVAWLSASGPTSATRFLLVQGLAAAALLGVFELAQYWIPHRHVQVEDLIAQTVGVCIVLGLIWVNKRLTLNHARK